MSINLTDYQKDMVEQIHDMKHCLLRMETGSGKTFTALEIVRVTKLHTMIICTEKQSKKQWLRSIDDMGVSEYCGVWTYHEAVTYLNSVIKKFEILIFDEVDNIINTSKRSKTFKKLFSTKKFKYNMGLSYTLVHKEELDVYKIITNLNMDVPLKRYFPTQKSFLTAYYIWGNSWDHFQQRMAHMPIKFDEQFREPFNNFSNIINYEDMTRFNKTSEYIPLIKPSMELYDYVKDTNVLPDYYTTLTSATKLNVLRQLMNSTMKYDDKLVKCIDEDYMIKFKKIEELQQKHGKVMVVYNFDAERKLLENYFKCTNDPEKLDEDYDILIRQIQRSSSIDIPQCNVIIFYTINYTAKDFIQMHGRITRYNSKFKDVFYYYLVWENTIEKSLYDVVLNKKLKKNQLLNMMNVND